MGRDNETIRAEKIYSLKCLIARLANVPHAGVFKTINTWEGKEVHKNKYQARSWYSIFQCNPPSSTRDVIEQLKQDYKPGI